MTNDRTDHADDEIKSRELDEHPDLYAINERTGFGYVKSRPGARKFTSEEVQQLLEDFP